MLANLGNECTNWRIVSDKTLFKLKATWLSGSHHMATRFPTNAPEPIGKLTCIKLTHVCQSQRNHPQILEIDIFLPTTENLTTIFYPLSVLPHLKTLPLETVNSC